MIDIRVRAHTLTCAASTGLNALRTALWNRESGLRKNDFPYSDLVTWIGRVAEVDNFEWTNTNSEWKSRNNALAAVGIEQDGFISELNNVVKELGRDRVGIVMGTSTSSIGHTEAAYRELENERLPREFHQPKVHNSHALSIFLANYTGLRGPAMTISTACSSSAKVFAAAARWLTANIVDAVLVGGVDSLCLSVLHGFNSLELISPSPCRPFDRRRDGINIGEAAGFALIVRASEAMADSVRCSGYGESSDAYHMSHPHPEGRGAEQAMRGALTRAQLSAEEIGYINLHGTASRVNDAVESEAIGRLFSPATKVSSTKGWTGHALGAAGITEAIIAIESLQASRIPGTLNLDEPDESLAFPVQQSNLETSLQHVMSNSFGFGGNNCSLVFSKGQLH
ncbi:MAG: beta-ketoacyl-ACP synthase [Gammaproteobacteria bacterium]|nr:beta-ketoacyl-ACP synthase [Gammaproteobacteria bacterium]